MVEMKVTEQTEASFWSFFLTLFSENSSWFLRVETALVSQMKGASYQLTDP